MMNLNKGCIEMVTDILKKNYTDTMNLNKGCIEILVLWIYFLLLQDEP